MNLEVDEDQQEIVALTRRICFGMSDKWCERDDSGNPRTISPQAMKHLGEAGAIGPRHPEPAGSGLGPVESVLVAEELGAALAPTLPLVWADVLGQKYPKALAGTAVLAVGISAGAPMAWAHEADVVITMDGAGARRAPDGESGGIASLSPDPSTPLSLMGEDAGGERIADASSVAEWVWQARLLAASHLVGMGRAVIEESTSYALGRAQFGRCIGSFQAIKHILADAYTAVELARSQTLFAALCWQSHRDDSLPQATAAYVQAGTAALQAAKLGIQIHGGMGFTDDSSPHRYYKRALAITASLGGPAEVALELLGREDLFG